MSSSNLISNRFSQDVQPGDIVDVIVVVSVVIFPVSLDKLSGSFCRKMSKDGSLRCGSGKEYNGVTGWESISKENLFIAFSRSRTTLILWGLGEKMFQESSSGWSETNNESEKWFMSEQVWIIDSGSFGLSFCHSESWLEEAELFVMTRVSLITSFTDIISALVEEMVTLTTDKALCVVCNERRCIPRVS